MIKAIKKIGLVAAIIGSLTLGGLTINNPKGLESKIPSIGMSAAEAMEYKAEGWEVPDMTGYEFVKEFDYDASKKVSGPETKIEHWKNKDGDVIFVCKFKGEIYGYGYGKADGSEGYSIIANKQKGIYDEKYSTKEEFDIPNRLL